MKEAAGGPFTSIAKGRCRVWALLLDGLPNKRMDSIRFREGVDLITMISLNATMESRDRVYGKFFI